MAIMEAMRFIDSHFHGLGMAARGIELGRLFGDLEGLGFAGGLDIGTRCDDLEKRIETIRPLSDKVLFTLGSGPWALQADADENEGKPIFSIDRIMEILKDNLCFKPCAIGEIGLDYHWDYGTREQQRELLERQLDLAYENALPVVIHCRDAMEDTLSILSAHKARGIIHCYSGSPSQALELQRQGWMISFAGNLTYPKARSLEESLACLDLSSILIETDAPYLAPQAYRGQVNSPLLILETYRKAAAIKAISVEKMGEIATGNFERLLGLSKEP